MKMPMNRRQAALAVLAVVLSAATLAPAQDTGEDNDAYLELVRRDIQTDKVILMTAALQLTDAQGEVFWPLYREYQLELSKIGDARIALLKDYAAHYDAMTDDKAAELMATSFDLQEKRLSLFKKTHKKVAKAIGPILAARFAQVESQLLDLIDVQIASEVPLVQ